MKQRKQLGVKIEGALFANDEHADIDLDQFLDKFIEFVESHHWHFGGGVQQIDDKGNKVADLK